MNPTQLSHELRNDQSADLKRRRWVVGLSLVGTLAGQIVSLYQMGIIKHLPDPPLSVFDSDEVDKADYAYSRFQTPDGLFMIINNGITAMLAGMGGKNRAKDKPLIPIALGVKSIVDAVVTLELAREEWQEKKKLCVYCQVATLASVAAAVIATPEMLKGIRQLANQHQVQ